MLVECFSDNSHSTFAQLLDNLKMREGLACHLAPPSEGLSVILPDIFAVTFCQACARANKKGFCGRVLSGNSHETESARCLDVVVYCARLLRSCLPVEWVIISALRTLRWQCPRLSSRLSRVCQELCVNACSARFLTLAAKPAVTDCCTPALCSQGN